MSTTDVEDTSVNDDDIELEDMEVSLEDMAEESDEASADESTEEESEADKTVEETEEESTDATEEEADETETEEPKEEDTTLKERQEAARIAFQEREAKRQAKSQAQSDYVAGAEDDRDLALRQLQIDAYNNKIESNSNKLQNSLDKAVAGIDLFTKGTDIEKAELADSLDDFEALYVKRDQNGDPIEVKADVYEYLQKKAESIRRLTGVGARQQEQDKSNTKSRTIAPPNAKPKVTKVDPDLAAFDDEAWKQIHERILRWLLTQQLNSATKHPNY